jgi:hypothetical protein
VSTRFGRAGLQARLKALTNTISHLSQERRYGVAEARLKPRPSEARIGAVVGCLCSLTSGVSDASPIVHVLGYT